MNSSPVETSDSRSQTPRSPRASSSVDRTPSKLSPSAADVDIRLVVVDLDGTLLDGDSRIPPGLWPIVAELLRRGVAFVPASGRQYATLRRTFGEHAEDMPFIAENGTYVVRDDVELGCSPVDRGFVEAAVGRVRDIATTHGRDLGVVLCGKRSAWVERTDAAFLEQCRPYYALLGTTPDVLTVDDDVLKLAVYDFGDAEHDTLPLLGTLQEGHQVVSSGRHWIDMMASGVDKGRAVEHLQRVLGVTRAQTAAFGDYLNDIQMLEAADWSFAMANGHPDVLRAARYVAPPNTEGGVLTVLRELFSLPR